MVTRYTGAVVQAVTASSGTMTTGTGLIPPDNTIPQITEGDQYLTVTITPTSAANLLEIEVLLYASNTVTPAALIAAVFQDSTANAVAASLTTLLTAGTIEPILVRHVMTAGTVSATTFKVRAGGGVAGTTTVNGASGTAYMGGVMQSRITVRELSA